MMNKMTVLMMVAAVILMAAGCSSNNSDNPTPAKNILETAKEAGGFDTLIAAVEAAGLADTLNGPGPFTVFAPTDAAFAMLPTGTVDSLLMPQNEGQLADILSYHVVPGQFDSQDVMIADYLDTAFGQDLAVSTDGGVMIGNMGSMAMVTQTDIPAGNGIIHVIDSVITPMDIVDVAAYNGSFTTLLTAVEAAGLESVLRGDGPFTVFAPTDDAFAALPEGTVESLLMPQNKDALIQILTYHVADRAISSAELAGYEMLEMVSGDSAMVSIDGSGASIDSANIVLTDLKAGNGIIHVISEVILPPM